MSTQAARKVRLTITLSPDLLERIDGSVGPGQSRSSVIEDWLRAASRRRAHDLLAAETVAYYQGATEPDEAEDRAWVRATAKALSGRDLDADASRSARRRAQRR